MVAVISNAIVGCDALAIVDVMHLLDALTGVEMWHKLVRECELLAKVCH